MSDYIKTNNVRTLGQKIRKYVFDKIYLPKNTKKVVIPYGFLREGARRSAEHKGAIIADDIYKILVNIKVIKPLVQFGGETFARFLINRRIIFEASQYFFSQAK